MGKHLWPPPHDRPQRPASRFSCPWTTASATFATHPPLHPPRTHPTHSCTLLTAAPQKKRKRKKKKKVTIDEATAHKLQSQLKAACMGTDPHTYFKRCVFVQQSVENHNATEQPSIDATSFAPLPQTHPGMIRTKAAPWTMMSSER